MNKKIIELPLPDFYRPDHAEDWQYSPDQYQLMLKAGDWRRKHAIKPAGTDTFIFHLLNIDAQKDFCYPQGTLYVGGRSGRGAIADNCRTAEFMYRNMRSITDITDTLDTHFAFQKFFPWYWIDENDRPLEPHTLIVLDGSALVNIAPDGKELHRNVKPNPAMASWLSGGNYPWLCQDAVFYCQELKRQGKYTLYLWPPHCILGSDGHALAGIIHEARMFHAFARITQSWCEVKGGHPLTENYSVFRPEVLMRWDGKPLAQKNTKFIEKITSADAVAICGQAASHCVKSTMEDLLDEIQHKDPELARKVYFLTDCTSSVAVPDRAGGFVVDFTDETEKSFRKFEAAGVHLVKSTDPIESWPDIKLVA